MNRQDHDTFVYARLKTGVTLDQAQSEMDLLYGRLAQAYWQSNSSRGARVILLSQSFAGDIRPTLLLLLGAAGFVLLIACSNVGNMSLARAVARQRWRSGRRSVPALPGC